jgi:4-oxalocrotonate tautomerase
MPIVTIQITREGVTPEQKAALIKGATDLMVDVLGKPPGLTFVVIQEVQPADWDIAGLPVMEYRRQTAASSAGEPVGSHSRRDSPFEPSGA